MILYPLNAAHGLHPVHPAFVPPAKAGNDVQPSVGPDKELDGSYYFVGTNTSYIEIPSNSKLDTKHSITILLMVYNERSEGPLVNYGRNSVSQVSLYLEENGAKLKWRLKHDVEISITTMKVNEWSLVGATYDYLTGRAAVWVDGKEINQTIFDTVDIATNFDIRIGAIEGDNHYFKGRISCLQFYDKALTGAEINLAREKCDSGGMSFYINIKLKLVLM